MIGTSLRGPAMAVAAFALWGLLPAYLAQLDIWPAADVMAWRAVFSALCLLLLLLLRQTLGMRLKLLWRSLQDNPRAFAWGQVAPALLLGASWLIFVHASMSGQMVPLSLGFFIAPLCIVLTGWAVLREKLRRLQWMALVITACGLALLLAQDSEGELWIPAGTAALISLYVLLRKQAGIEPLTALLGETLILAPPALFWLGFSPLSTGLTAPFAAEHLADLALLAGTGLFTVTVMGLWLAAARLLPMSTLGMMGFIEPGIAFLLGVLVFDEPFGWIRAIVFTLIWLGMILYMTDLQITRRRGMRA